MSASALFANPRLWPTKLAIALDDWALGQIRKLAPTDLPEAQTWLDGTREIAASIKPEYFSEPDSFFTPPGPVTVHTKRLSCARVGALELRWDSQPPMVFKDIEEEYRSHRVNNLARLRVLSNRIKGRPVAIFVNGFASGHHVLERLAWPFAEFEKRNINSALFALPFHGPRCRYRMPEWPAENVRFTIEGFRQAIWDLRVAINTLRNEGASHVGVIGMSLGGYTTALMATVEASLDFAVPFVPIASIPYFMKNANLIPGEPDVQAQLFEEMTALHNVTGPLGRPCLVPTDRVVVISGEHDRLATVDHGQLISEHFGCELVTFPGAHILQSGRRRSFRQFLSRIDSGQILGQVAA